MYWRQTHCLVFLLFLSLYSSLLSLSAMALLPLLSFLSLLLELVLSAAFPYRQVFCFSLIPASLSWTSRRAVYGADSTYDERLPESRVVFLFLTAGKTRRRRKPDKMTAAVSTQISSSCTKDRKKKKREKNEVSIKRTLFSSSSRKPGSPEPVAELSTMHAKALLCLSKSDGKLSTCISLVYIHMQRSSTTAATTFHPQRRVCTSAALCRTQLEIRAYKYTNISGSMRVYILIYRRSEATRKCLKDDECPYVHWNPPGNTPPPLHAPSLIHP